MAGIIEREQHGPQYKASNGLWLCTLPMAEPTTCPKAKLLRKVGVCVSVVTCSV